MQGSLMILFILSLYSNFFRSTAGLVCNNITLAGQGKPRIEAQQSKPSVLESGVASPKLGWVLTRIGGLLSAGTKLEDQSHHQEISH